MWEFLLVIFFATLGPFSSVRVVEAGLKYIPTKGEAWPKPQKQIKTQEYYLLKDENVFNVTKPFHTCDILDKAVIRLLYDNLLNKFRYIKDKTKTNEINADMKNNELPTSIYNYHTEFQIELTKKCEDIPYLDMDEKYELVVEDSIVINSASVWGILRGLQTFNQLLYFSDDYTEIRINATLIEDFPAYKHRGLLIDTGRHFLHPRVISRLIDSMEMNKLNVLHWHIVDDQSFPYESKMFPALSKNGAFHPSMVYTRADIRYLIEQARLAGIRVIPEFDVPGHVRSWGKSYPNILTKCYVNNTVIGLGPLNPIKNETYNFLKKLYREVNYFFPDEYIHIGGDEVDETCWISNPEVKKSAANISLQSYFLKKVISLLPSQRKPIFWEDVFDMNKTFPEKTIFQVWRYNWVQKMDKILAANHRVLFSSTWYLDILEKSWEYYYNSDPRQMLYLEYLKQNRTPICPRKLKNILGGEACMWGETVDETNIFTRVWPNTAAVAERLWSGLSTTIHTLIVEDHDPHRRIVEHSCRMRQAGIPVAPALGPGYCLDKPLREKGSA